MAKFMTPVIQDNPSGWGPCAVPEQFRDMPYQPFSKGDRLGKVLGPYSWGGYSTAPHFLSVLSGDMLPVGIPDLQDESEAGQPRAESIRGDADAFYHPRGLCFLGQQKPACLTCPLLVFTVPNRLQTGQGPHTRTRGIQVSVPQGVTHV